MKAILATMLLVAAPCLQAGEPALLDKDDALYEKVEALDRQLFDAYNRCDLAAFRALLADDLKFYHDRGGVTRSPEEVTDGVRKNICGKVRRELVPGTLEVDRIEGYGALEVGIHRFCEPDGTRCMGIARFLQIWRQDGDVWKATRIVSFGHRPLPETE